MLYNLLPMPESFEPLRPESLEPLRTVSALGIPDDMLKIVCLVYEIDLGVDVSKEGVAKYEIGVVTLLPKVIFLADEDVEVEAEDVFCRDLASEERIKYYVLECDDDLGRNVDEGIDSMGLRKRRGMAIPTCLFYLLYIYKSRTTRACLVFTAPNDDVRQERCIEGQLTIHLSIYI